MFACPTLQSVCLGFTYDVTVQRLTDIGGPELKQPAGQPTVGLKSVCCMWVGKCTSALLFDLLRRGVEWTWS